MNQIKKRNLEEQQHNSVNDKTESNLNNYQNSVSSSLVLGGGCFGKIYNCVRHAKKKDIGWTVPEGR